MKRDVGGKVNKNPSFKYTGSNLIHETSIGTPYYGRRVSWVLCEDRKLR